MKNLRLLSLASCVVVATATFTSVSAKAQTVTAPVSAEFRLNMPSQPLGAALSMLGSTTRTNIAFEPRTVAGLYAPALNGNYSLAEALNVLLRPSGLAAEELGENSFVIISQKTAKPVRKTKFRTEQADPATHSNIIEEVVVTGSRRRRENVQTTPIAITALNSTLMERNHVTDIKGIASLVPNVEINPPSASSGVDTFYLRGFGTFSDDPASDPRVAVYVDGVYQPSTVGTTLDMFDIDQVEVDAGPQGTLAGKNAPVGAVNITTAPPPNTFGGEVETDYGSYNQVGARAKIGGPLLSTPSRGVVLAGNLSLVYKEGGNWVYNEANGKYDMGGVNGKVARLALRFTPSDNFSWNVIASVDKDNDPQEGDRNVGFVTGGIGVPGNVATVYQPPAIDCVLFFPGGKCPLTAYGTTDSNFTTGSSFVESEVSSTMAYRFTPVTATLVSGHVQFYELDSEDVAGTPFSVLNGYNNRTTLDQESEEFRISSNKGGGWTLGDKLDWLIGGYESNFHATYDNILGVLNGTPATPNTGIQYANVKEYERDGTQSSAVFIHLIYNFTSQWTGTFGVRQSWDHKAHAVEGVDAASLNGYVGDPPAGWHNLSFEAGTAYQFDPHRMAYFRFAQGYESGGFAGLAQDNVYNPELSDNYEIGFKSDWLDRRLRVNADLFTDQISQLQVASAALDPSSPTGFLQETLNAGKATVQGAEFQVLAVPAQNLTLRLNLGYLDPKYDKYFGTTCSTTGVPTDCSGVPFSFAPKWNGNLGGDYIHDLPRDWGTVDFNASVDFKSGLYPYDPPYPTSFQPGYALVNAGIRFLDFSQLHSLEFYGTNILNRHYRNSYGDPAGISTFETDGRPAEWGVRVTAKF